MRINRGDRKAALTGATGGAVVGGASGAGIGAAIGLAMIPIAPVSVPIGFVVGGLIGGVCGAPSGAAVAVKRGRNTNVEELNVADARRYGDHDTGDMVRLRDDVELPEQDEDPSTYATEPINHSTTHTSTKRVSDIVPEEEGQFNTWSSPMGLSAPATTPSYAYGTSSASKTRKKVTTTTTSYGDDYGANSTYGYNKAYAADVNDEDPAERLMRMRTAPKPTSSYGEESNRGRRSKSFDDDDDSDGDIDYEGEKALERRGSRNRRGNLVQVLPPEPATDVHLRHFDPQQELSRRFDDWERKDNYERERERRERERKDEEYARQLQRQFDREERRTRTSTSSKKTASTTTDPEKTLDSLWRSEPFY